MRTPHGFDLEYKNLDLFLWNFKHSLRITNKEYAPNTVRIVELTDPLTRPLKLSGVGPDVGVAIRGIFTDTVKITQVLTRTILIGYTIYPILDS